MEEGSSVMRSGRSATEIAEKDQENMMQLHGSESPGVTLVSMLLDGKNFLTWQRMMKVALKAKGKLQFVDGRCPPPSKESSDFWQWEKADNMVFSWIISSMAKDVVPIFIHASNARDLWESIEQRFSTCNGPMLYQLEREIFNHNQGNLPLIQYFNQLKSYWDEFDAHTAGMGAEQLRDLHRIMQFLMGLNNSYENARQQILMMEPLPSLNKVFSLVMSVESELNLHGTTPSGMDDSVLMARTITGSKREIWKQRTAAEKMKMICEHCKKRGHTKETCFEIVGYPDWFKDMKKGKQGDRKQTGQRGNDTANLATSVTEVIKDEISKYFTRAGLNDPISLSVYCNLGEENKALNKPQTPLFLDKAWIIDTGASSHITSCLSIMSNVSQDLKLRKINLPDGTTRSVKHIGDVRLSSNLVLKEVLHVPSFKYNLISVGKLTEENSLMVNFYQNCCLVQDQESKKTLGIGRMRNGLYVLDNSSIATFCNIIDSASGESDDREKLQTTCSTKGDKDRDTLNIWHSRLGHPSKVTMNHMEILKPHIEIQNTDVCEICPAAKQHRLPFPSSTITTGEPFTLLHMDIWGPYHQRSITGASYFLTIVDDYTKVTWIYLMNSKQQTTACIQKHIMMIKNQHQGAVKVIRTDNGAEFLSRTCQSLLHESGILHQRSCVYTPQQNGVVERKHQHLIQVARALLFQANLTPKFWGEAILMAAYLINRLPSQVLNWESPYQRFYGCSPDLSELRIFGSLCFAVDSRPHKTKFSPRGLKCIFLGFASGVKGYKVYDIQENRLLNVFGWL